MALFVSVAMAQDNDSEVTITDSNGNIVDVTQVGDTNKSDVQVLNSSNGNKITVRQTNLRNRSNVKINVTFEEIGEFDDYGNQIIHPVDEPKDLSGFKGSFTGKLFNIPSGVSGSFVFNSVTADNWNGPSVTIPLQTNRDCSYVWNGVAYEDCSGYCWDNKAEWIAALGNSNPYLRNATITSAAWVDDCNVCSGYHTNDNIWKNANIECQGDLSGHVTGITSDKKLSLTINSTFKYEKAVAFALYSVNASGQSSAMDLGSTGIVHVSPSPEVQYVKDEKGGNIVPLHKTDITTYYYLIANVAGNNKTALDQQAESTNLTINLKKVFNQNDIDGMEKVILELDIKDEIEEINYETKDQREENNQKTDSFKTQEVSLEKDNYISFAPYVNDPNAFNKMKTKGAAEVWTVEDGQTIQIWSKQNDGLYSEPEFKVGQGYWILSSKKNKIKLEGSYNSEFKMKRNNSNNFIGPGSRFYVGDRECD
jgi:hypothetical protein